MKITSNKIVTYLEDIKREIFFIIYNKDQGSLDFYKEAFSEAQSFLSQMINSLRAKEEILSKGLELFPHLEAPISDIKKEIALAEELLKKVDDVMKYLDIIQF